jgi:hypothetical protein
MPPPTKTPKARPDDAPEPVEPVDIRKTEQDWDFDDEEDDRELAEEAAKTGK